MGCVTYIRMVLCGGCDLHKGGVYGVGCVTYIRMVLCGLCDLHKGGVYGVGWSPT